MFIDVIINIHANQNLTWTSIPPKVLNWR